MSSSYRSSRLGLLHWDPYAMHGGVVLMGFKPYLKDQLASFGALTLLVLIYDL